MKTGEIYANLTRKQLVEVMDIDGRKKTVEYRVIEGNEDNRMKVFKCMKTRFERLYIKSNKFLNF